MMIILSILQEQTILNMTHFMIMNDSKQYVFIIKIVSYFYAIFFAIKFFSKILNAMKNKEKFITVFIYMNWAILFLALPNIIQTLLETGNMIEYQWWNHTYGLRQR